MRGLKITNGKQVQPNLSNYLSKIDVLNIYYVIFVLTKYAWVKPLKDKKDKTVLHDFIEIVNESNHKPNKFELIKEKSFPKVLCKMVR